MAKQSKKKIQKEATELVEKLMALTKKQKGSMLLISDIGIGKNLVVLAGNEQEVIESITRVMEKDDDIEHVITLASLINNLLN